MTSFLRRLLGSSRTRRRPPSARLALEALESRVTPSVAAGPHGESYTTWYSSDSLYERSATGAWTSMNATGVTSVAVGANGTVAAVFNDSSLKEYNPANGTWSLVDTDVGLATVGPQGQLYYTHGAGEQLWERDTPASTPYVFSKSGVTALSAGADGAVDAVFSDGSVQKLTGGKGGAWMSLYDSGMSAVTAGPHGEVFVSYGSSHALEEYSAAGGWQSLNASNASALSMGADGNLDAVFSNGSVWQWNLASRQWGSAALFGSANSDAAGPTLGQKAIQFGLDHRGQGTADPGLPYTCADFVAAALESAGAKTTADYGVTGMDPSLNYVWGNLVVQHNAGGPVSDLSLIQPGDIIQFRYVVLTTAYGSYSFPQHTAIVYQNLGNGKITFLEQNVNKQQFVTLDTYDLSTMTGGTFWVYQPVAK